MLRTQSGIQVEKWEAKCPQKNKPDDHSACANKGSILTNHCSGNELTLLPWKELKTGHKRAAEVEHCVTKRDHDQGIAEQIPNRLPVNSLLTDTSIKRTALEFVSAFLYFFHLTIYKTDGHHS